MVATTELARIGLTALAPGGALLFKYGASLCTDYLSANKDEVNAGLLEVFSGEIGPADSEFSNTEYNISLPFRYSFHNTHNELPIGQLKEMIKPTKDE